MISKNKKLGEVWFGLELNGNALRSCFDDDKFWPKFGGFFAKEVMVLNFTYKFEDVVAL
jgi:hypothetical protein